MTHPWLALLPLSLLLGAARPAPEVVVHPREYPHALRNPLMGFRAGCGPHEWSTLAKTYIRWRDIENEEGDGIEKIRDYCDRAWREGGGDRPVRDPAQARGVEELNIKVIPRVYLHWDGDKKFWPADLQADDYASDAFKRRVERLVGRLGELWDNDPRVAYVEMGLIGKWGEHHTPSVTPEMQRFLGDLFSRAFKHKLVMVRHPWDFTEYRFGIYWDSWAHVQQMDSHGAGIAKLGDRWQAAPMGGEAAYNWGRYQEQPGESPTDTVSDPAHRRYFIDSVRWLHCNHVGWVSAYDAKDETARRGAEEVQKALGYRFVIDQARYPARVEPGGRLRVSFQARNTGSSPFYYNWPVEVSLLDPRTRRPVWSGVFPELDIRTWLPGDRWNKERQEYEVAPKPYTVAGTFTLPAGLAKGEYVLALAILDPAGNLPSARFAITNYFSGGRHPLGRIGVGQAPATTAMREEEFDDPAADRTLHYVVKR